MKTHYRTIVLSDIHLGTSGSKAKEVTNFLKQHTCDTLILNGDIIDGWQLQKYGKWKKAHTKFFKKVIRMAEHNKTQVIYLRGNHDDFLDQLIPMNFGNISVIRDFIYEDAKGRRMYVLHGDIFDTITTNLKWIAKLGDIGYTFLLWLNKYYNLYRSKRGLPYYSLSQAIKHKVKGAVSYISKYEDQLADLAKAKKCEGVVCGHIHQPAIKTIDNVLYLNSGDWVESLTALIETIHGEWKLVYYNEQFAEPEIEADDEEEVVIPAPWKHKDVTIIQPRFVAMNGLINPNLE
ncbi:MAG: UDP-2,3-diacylglucosamine diphosphatase [Cytophagaceae bacterium]